jgi:hypothetical protein
MYHYAEGGQEMLDQLFTFWLDMVRALDNFIDHIFDPFHREEQSDEEDNE